MKSIEVKILATKQFYNLHLYTKCRGFALDCLGEIGIESCQNVNALPEDKPIYNLKQIEE
jgi:hypothetical protein